MDNYFKMLVSPTLEHFLNEWVDRGEDRWADREIDKWEKEKSGVVLSEDPAEILTHPEDIDVPSDEDIETIKKILRNLVEFKRNSEVTPEEFQNFCLWVTRVSNDPHRGSAIVSAFIENMPSMVQELKSAGREGMGGRYSSGFELLADKYNPNKGNDYDS